VHDVTGGARTADYFVGLGVGLLPFIGVALGAVRTRGPRRVFRMLVFGAVGFIVTYLLSPSPARYLTDHSSRRVFDEQAPGYLAGVFTGAMVWLAALVLAVVLARKWWRRLTSRYRHSDADPGSPSRVIDI
jgi:Na+-driven multidrug efflux pump